MRREAFSSVGGRKFTISMYGVTAVVLLAAIGATTSEAFIAIGTIVLSYCGGNAAVEWKHAGSSRTENTRVSQEIVERRALGAEDGSEPT